LLRKPIVWVLFAVLVGVGAIRSWQRSARSDAHVAAPAAPEKQLPSFRLVDSRGAAFGAEELEDDVWIANFFFTRCMSICPEMMGSLVEFRSRLGAAGLEGVRFVSFSVDPEHDTPARLAAYAAERGIETGPGWTLLTGPEPQMRSLLVDSFEVPMGVPEPVGELIDVAHSGKIALVEGSTVRGFYSYDAEGLDQVFARVRELVTGRGKGFASRGS
jgi:protein SCO1/2